MHKNLLLLLLLTLFLQPNRLFSQCFQVLDGNGVASATPYFISCAPGDFTVFIQPDMGIGAYTIDWGDGSGLTAGASLVPPAFESHTYLSTTDTFNVVITETGTGCVVNGVVVMERNPLASIQLPAGDDNFGCTPVQFRFINSSTQVSETTTFTWDFGDGTGTQTFDFTNQGDTITYTYMPGVGVLSCEINVTLTATNRCGSSTASFFPLRVWDLDEARIDASATLLCYPDTVVQYTNNTQRNCFPEGNQSQRYERWNFGDYWGLGYDSIIDWRPWNPPIVDPPPIAYPGIGTYTVMLIDSSFCGLDTAFQTINITNGPTSVITSSEDTICAGEQVRFFNGSFGGANRYAWNYDLGAGWQNQGGGTKTRTYNTPGNYTIGLAVRINGAQGCNDTSYVNLVVLPSPTAAFTFDNNNECDSMTVNFTNNTSGSPIFWRWDFGNGNSFIGQNPPSQNYNAPGTYTVQLYTENTAGCADSISQTIRVRETPAANFSATSVCVNETAQFTDLSTASVDPVTSWKWYFGDGDSSSVQNPTHVYTAFGTYNVTQIVNNGFCADTNMTTVTVESLPTAAFTADTLQGCSRLTVNFTNQSSANAVTFRWDFGDGSPIDTNRNPTHQFSNTSTTDRTYIVEMIASTVFGCTDTIVDTVTVFPVPTPSFTSDAVLDCGPLTVNFTNLTTGSNLQYFWDFGDGSPIVNDTNPSHVFNNTTLFISNYQVSLIVASANGCRDTTTQTVTVYPEPVFTFTVIPDSGCSPLSVTFPSVVGAVSYEWDFGDGTTATGPTPTHIFINNTTNDLAYSVRLVAQNGFGCRDTSFRTVLVHPNPTSIFTVDTTVGCQPLPITITNTSQGANRFIWDYGDGNGSDTAAASFVYTYSNTAQSASFNNLQLITETDRGCRDTSNQVIEVHPFIQAAFSSDTLGCSPLTLAFTNQSVGANAYDWNFGDGTSSNSINPSHTFLNTTNVNVNYLVNLRAVSNEGCVDSAAQNILVFPKPTAVLSFSDTIGCHPLAVTLTNSSSLADSCFWDFGDGNVNTVCSPSINYTYNNAASLVPVDYTTTFRVFTANGCSDTLTQDIQVYPNVIADFTSDTVGCSPYPVTFINQSIGAQTFQWTFGDGSNTTATNPSHVYTNPGLTSVNYTAQLLAVSQFNCRDSVTRDITVYAKPQANYSLDVTDGCHPLPVTFTNSSSIADSCSWSFGDGTISDSCFISQVHTYSNTLSAVPVNYQSQLIVVTNNGCSDTTTRNVSVRPEVIAAFSSDTVGCSPLPINFQNQSVGGQNYSWTFGDGNTSNSLNTSHTYVNPGLTDQTYTAELLVVSQYNCRDSVSQDILIYAKPVADYSVDVTDGCHPLPVTFANNSSIADSCSWSFGDGTLDDSCFVSLVHTYSNTLSAVPVNYQSQLIVVTNNGCSDTTTRNVSVRPEVIAAFSSDTVGCSPLPINFQNQSVGGQNYSWTFGDGNTSNSLNTSHTYVNPGLTDQTYTAELLVVSQYNCRDSVSQDILVYAKPIADYSVDVTDGCHPLPVTFANTSSIADSCSWSFGDGTLDDSCFVSQIHTYSNTLSAVPVNYQSQLIVVTNNGCSDTTTRNVNVRPEVIAAFSSDTVGCSPLPVNFQNQSVGGQNYSWTFGDGNTSNSLNTSHTYVNPGLTAQTYTAELLVVSQYNCRDSVSQDILVYAKPIADYTVDVNDGCHPLPVTFANNSSIADSCAWSFGDGTINDTCFTNLTHTYSNTLSSVPVNYLSQLIVVTDSGCSDTINQNIQVRPQVVAAFDTVFNGCTPLAVQFQNQSIGGTTFAWTFGDGGGQPARNPQHFFINPGFTDTTFTTKLVVESAFQCIDSVTQDITIFPKPVADYTVDVNRGCQPLEVNFTDNSIIADSCNWTFGDGGTLTQCSPIVNHTYSNTISLVPLNYESRLEVITDRGCTDTLSRFIEVLPQVTADFTIDNLGCSPLFTTARSQSFGAISYEWDFGDGGQANGMIAAHTFRNTGSIDSVYQVRLIARSLYQCNDTAFQNVRVHPTPLVDFDATPVSQIFPNSTVTLTNQTNAGNWSYVWDFGDTSSGSTQANPVSHTYGIWGTYPIQLVASGANCADSITKVVTIEVPFPIADFGDSASGCSPLEVTFENRSLYGRAYQWDFGDNTSSSLENPSHTYFQPGQYSVSLRVLGFEDGKEDFIQKAFYIEVFESPNAAFFVNKETVFIPNDPLVMFNTSRNADRYVWDFGDGNTSTEENPTHFYQEEGEFLIQLFAYTNEGCVDTFDLGRPVIADLEGTIVVPNAFTPNPNGSNGGRVNPLAGIDQLNDVFYAKISGSINYELNIFNKWGELLFVSTDVNVGWDGYYKGELCKQDAYVWKVKAEFADGTRIVKVGDLLLLR